jgi:hypothetical protein
LNCISSLGTPSAIPEEADEGESTHGLLQEIPEQRSGGYTEDCFSSRAAAAVLVTEAKSLIGRKEAIGAGFFDRRRRCTGSGVITVGWVSVPSCSSLGNRSEEPEKAATAKAEGWF